jgi:hypothetical protein
MTIGRYSPMVLAGTNRIALARDAPSAGERVFEQQHAVFSQLDTELDHPTLP